MVTLFASLVTAMPKWVDSSHNILLPAKVSAPLSATNQFPLFWWNFLVLELPQDNSWDSLEQLCRDLHGIDHKLVERVACGEDLRDYQAAVTAWAADLPLRRSAVSVAEVKRAFADALTKASLSLGISQ